MPESEPAARAMLPAADVKNGCWGGSWGAIAWTAAFKCSLQKAHVVMNVS
jgi:hypothetical protein